jgi:hypothetical protein
MTQRPTETTRFHSVVEHSHEARRGCRRGSTGPRRFALEPTCSAVARSTRDVDPDLFIQAGGRQRLSDHFEREFSEAFSPLVVNSRAASQHVRAGRFRAGSELEDRGAPPDSGREKGRLGPGRGWRRAGMASGCAGREQSRGPRPRSPYTTVVVPPGKRFSVDEYGLGLLGPA